MSRSLACAAAVFALAMLALLAACAPTPREAFGTSLDRAQAQGQPLLIYTYGVPGVVAVGTTGAVVPVYMQFVVTGGRPLKHVQFVLVGHGARGIPIRSRNGQIEAVVLNGPGLFKAGQNYEVNSYSARPVGFPGGAVACVDLVRVKVVYANGERKTYTGLALQKLLLPSLRRNCPDMGVQVNRLTDVLRH